MNLYLKRVVYLFSTRCFDDAAAVADPPEETEVENGGIGGGEEKIPTEKPVENELDSYVGSEEVNPSKRPLKNFDRKGMTKEAIDRMIMAAGEDIFLTDEQIAGIEKKKKEETGKKEEKTEEKDVKKSSETDTSVTDFFKNVGIEEKDFTALPETVQEKIVSLYEGSGGKNEESEKLISDASKKNEELQKIIDNLADDSVIAARLEELKTGRRYNASDLPTPTFKEAQALAELADDPDKFRDALTEFLASKAETAVTVERSVAEQRFTRKQLESDALKVVSEIMAKEPRLATVEKDLNKIREGHPEYDKLWGKSGVMGLMKKSGYNLKQIKEFGTDRLLNDISHTMGWTSERFKKAEKNGAKKLLDKIREKHQSARTIDMGKKSSDTIPSEKGGYSRESLIADIVAGNSENFSQLLEQAGDRCDFKRVQELRSIREEALSEMRRKRQPGD